MAASKIRISPDEMEKQVAVLRKSKTAHQDVRKKLMNLMSQIAIEWQGDAADAYLKQFAAMAPAFEVFDENTELIAQSIEQTALRFENKDKELGRRYEALD